MLDFHTALDNPTLVHPEDNWEALVPVSYTHLAVYKRQFFNRDTHKDNYLTTREGRSLPIEHCIEGEDGWNFAPRCV